MSKPLISVVLPNKTAGEAPALAPAGKQASFEAVTPGGVGKGAACNRGIDAARGVYIAFAAEPDPRLLQTLTALAEAAERSGADMTLCGTAGEEPLPAQTLEGRAAVRRFALSRFPWAPGELAPGLYRTDFLREQRVRFPEEEGAREELFLLRAFDRAERVRVIPAPPCLRQEGEPEGSPVKGLKGLGQIAGEYLDMLDRWGVREPAAEDKIRLFYLNRAVRWMESLYLPGSRSSGAERKACLKQFHLDPTFRRWAGRYEGLSRYAAGLLRLVEREKYRRIPLKMGLRRLVKKDRRSV